MLNVVDHLSLTTYNKEWKEDASEFSDVRQSEYSKQEWSAN